MTRPDICPTCAPTRTGTCARLRCYCGHEACWAFASWVPTGLGDVVSFEVAGRERVAGAVEVKNVGIHADSQN